MPEATVYKHGYADPSENDIGNATEARQGPLVDPVAKSLRMEKRP